MDVALSFHTTFVNGAITHFLRANLVSEAWCEAWDNAALQFWELELQRVLNPDQRQQFFLPLKDAGSGVQSAELRRAAAFLGSWELCLHDVAKTVGLSTAETVRARLPALVEDIATAEAALRARGVEYSFDWEAGFARAQQKGQKSIMKLLHKTMRQELATQLPTDDGQGATFQSSGGKGAGSSLLSPLAGEGAVRMNDDDLRASLRARFRCDYPGFERNAQPAPSTHCKHIYTSRTVRGPESSAGWRWISVAIIAEDARSAGSC